MLWAALLLDSPSGDASQRTDAASGLVAWALQFTPRVAITEPLSASPAVVMEVGASVRLFGGKRKLAERVRQESAELGVTRLAWSPTGLASVALARGGVSNGFSKPLEQLLDALPIQTLSAVAAHQPTLARLGCQTLGQVRAFPRGGLSRRFDAQLLAAMDQAYGLRPEVHEWVTVPDAFCERLELVHRVELAPALLFAARRLLLMMSGWLAARQCGVRGFTLRWRHDSLWARSPGEGGELTIRTAQPTRDMAHLTRLLSEHLAKVELGAPVGDIALEAIEVHHFEDQNLSLLPDANQTGESLGLVLERIAARLGPERVLRPQVVEDHRGEWMCEWVPYESAAKGVQQRPLGRLVDIPQPTFMLPEPLRLATRGHRPLYQGELQLLAGPHRVEGGWWDRMEEEGVADTRNVMRDYWVALNEFSGLLWIFQTRLADEQTAWFLHGHFA
jgi:protein ImuB